MDINQAQTGEDLVTYSIAYMSEYDKPNLLEMLQRSGSLVTEMSTQDEMLDASFKALKDSDRFRKDLANYIKSVTSLDDYSNYVDDAFVNKAGKYDPTTGTGGTRVGNTLRNIFSQENIAALTTLGIGFAQTKLQNAASKQGNQQAIDFKKAEAEAALAETEKIKAQATAGGINPETGKKRAGWVLPVAIGGGVLVLGVVLYFALRKKN